MFSPPWCGKPPHFGWHTCHGTSARGLACHFQELRGRMCRALRGSTSIQCWITARTPKRDVVHPETFDSLTERPEIIRCATLTVIYDLHVHAGMVTSARPVLSWHAPTRCRWALGGGGVGSQNPMLLSSAGCYDVCVPTKRASFPVIEPSLLGHALLGCWCRPSRLLWCRPGVEQGVIKAMRLVNSSSMGDQESGAGPMMPESQFM